MKRICSFISIGFIFVAVFFLCNYMGNWPQRYSKEFDKFFGNDWTYEKLPDKYDEHLGYTRYGRYGSRHQVGTRVLNWGVDTANGSYIITNHAHRYNQQTKNWFNCKRRSAKESLWYEFLDIALIKCSYDMEWEYVTNVLGEEYCDAIRVDVDYKSNPTVGFLHYLAQSDWLTIDTTVDELMGCEKQGFEIYISLYDYKYEKLNATQRRNVEEWFYSMEEILLERFGGNATFTLYYGPDDNDDSKWRVEYKNGEKQGE